MKKFDTIKWIRGVRDSQHARNKDLSPDEKLKKTKSEAEAFRASRGGSNVSSGASGEGSA